MVLAFAYVMELGNSVILAALTIVTTEKEKSRRTADIFSYTYYFCGGFEKSRLSFFIGINYAK